MQTIHTAQGSLLQIHKNHVVAPLAADTTLRVIDLLTKQERQIQFEVKELTNCYLLTISSAVVDLDRTQQMELVNADGTILYSSILTVVTDNTPDAIQ